MQCNHEDTPTIALMNQVMHIGMCSSEKKFAEYDLKPWQVMILFVLNHNVGFSQRELAAKLNLTPPTITSAIQKMEKQGYIVRKPDEKDQRVMRLYVTDKSRECTDNIMAVVHHMEEVMFRGFSMEERLLFRRLLLQMRDNMKSEKTKWSKEN